MSESWATTFCTAWLLRVCVLEPCEIFLFYVLPVDIFYSDLETVRNEIGNLLRDYSVEDICHVDGPGSEASTTTSPTIRACYLFNPDNDLDIARRFRMAELFSARMSAKKSFEITPDSPSFRIQIPPTPDFRMENPIVRRFSDELPRLRFDPQIENSKSDVAEVGPVRREMFAGGMDGEDDEEGELEEEEEEEEVKVIRIVPKSFRDTRKSYTHHDFLDEDYMNSDDEDDGGDEPGGDKEEGGDHATALLRVFTDPPSENATIAGGNDFVYVRGPGNMSPDGSFILRIASAPSTASGEGKNGDRRSGDRRSGVESVISLGSLRGTPVGDLTPVVSPDRNSGTSTLEGDFFVL